MIETLKLKEFEKECIITLPEGSVLYDIAVYYGVTSEIVL